MNGNDVPDEVLELIRGLLVPRLEIRQIFTETDLVAIYLVGIQPDSVLRQFGIVKLSPMSVGVIIHPLAPEEKQPGWDRDHGSGSSQRGDRCEVVLEILRRVRSGRRGERGPGHEEEEA